MDSFYYVKIPGLIKTGGNATELEPSLINPEVDKMLIAEVAISQQDDDEYLSVKAIFNRIDIGKEAVVWTAPVYDPNINVNFSILIVYDYLNNSLAAFVKA